MSETSTVLTPAQVENWRKTLCGMIGPYALIMPVSEVQKMRDHFQKIADESSNNNQDEENHE